MNGGCDWWPASHTTSCAGGTGHGPGGRFCRPHGRRATRIARRKRQAKDRPTGAKPGRRYGHATLDESRDLAIRALVALGVVQI